MRIRTIKPEFFTHTALFDAEVETKLPLRVAYAGLWCAADREGRFVWEPRRLKVWILPYDEVDFSRVLDALATRGFLVKYASGTGVFGVIPSFKTHQFVNNKEMASTLPEPPSETTQVVDNEELDASVTRDSRVSHGNPKSESGREGKGREGKIQRESEDKIQTSERIMTAYPKRGKPQEILPLISESLKTTSPDEMLENVSACAEAMDLAPGGRDNAFWPNPVKFFREEQWRDPGAFFGRADKLNSEVNGKQKPHTGHTSY